MNIGSSLKLITNFNQVKLVQIFDPYCKECLYQFEMMIEHNRLLKED